MPRQTLTKTTAPSPNPTTGTAVTFTAANLTDKEQFTLTGRELILVKNDDAQSQTYTVNTVADPYGRTKDITTASIAAGAIHCIGPIGLVGWQQSDGMLYLEASDTDVKFAVITLP